MCAVEIIRHRHGDKIVSGPHIEVIIDVDNASSAADFAQQLEAAVVLKDPKEMARLFNERIAGTSKQKRGLHENGTGYASDEAPLVKGGRRG